MINWTYKFAYKFNSRGSIPKNATNKAKYVFKEISQTEDLLKTRTTIKVPKNS